MTSAGRPRADRSCGSASARWTTCPASFSAAATARPLVRLISRSLLGPPARTVTRIADSFLLNRGHPACGVGSDHLRGLVDLAQLNLTQVNGWTPELYRNDDPRRPFAIANAQLDDVRNGTKRSKTNGENSPSRH